MMMKNNTTPKVSIVVPCYNVERYLDRCLNSLVNQSLQEIEIILVDDGSPDRVPEMCDSWAMRDNRIKVIHKKNAGLGYARNNGLEIAKGEYIAFVDGDDYISTDTYRIAYEEAQKEEACVVFFNMKREHKKHTWSDEKQIWEGKQITDYILDMIACAPCVKEERKWGMSACHGIYQHSIIGENNLQFHSEWDCLCEDILFNIDFLRCANKIVYIPNKLYYYCINPNSTTATFRLDKYDRLLCLYKLLLQKTNGIEGGEKRVDRFFIDYAQKYITDLVRSHFVSKKRNILKRVLNDNIWDDLRVRYKPDWLPLLQNVFYRLVLRKHLWILMVYVYWVSLIRQYVVVRKR